jgi:hypothetical protein
MADILVAMAALSPTEFENLTYDCLRAAGLKNMVWRTPGTDAGRDIEGVAYARDLSGHENVQRWYVECKRFSNSIDWPTVWQKIAYADVQNADVLLIVTTSNPSPQCETQISEWNSKRRWPAVKFWRGYDFSKILRAYPHVAAAYGLNEIGGAAEVGAFDLAFLITKITQAAYVGTELGVGGSMALEAAASLAELLSQRLDDLSRFSHFVSAFKAVDPINLDWAEIKGSASQWEDTGIRALLAFLRYLFNARSLRIVVSGTEAKIEVIEAKLKITVSALEQISLVAHWARAEVNIDSALKSCFVARQRI